VTAESDDAPATGLLRVLARRVGTRLRRAWDERSQQRWQNALARDLQQATRGGGEFREIHDVRRERAARHRERGEMPQAAAETWALVGLALKSGDLDAASTHAYEGLPLLEHASDIVWDLAYWATAHIGGAELRRRRAAPAAKLYAAAIEAWTRSDRAAARMTLTTWLASAQWQLGQYHDALATTAIALSLARRLAGATAADPYREVPGHARLELWDPIGVRDTIVTTYATRVLVRAVLGAFDEIAHEVSEANALFDGGLSSAEVRPLTRARGWAAYRQGDYAAAERLYGEASEGLQDDATRLLALEGLGWAYIELGFVDEAAGLAKEVLAVTPHEHAAQTIRAVAEWKRNSHDLAEQFARAVVGDEAASPDCRSDASRVLAEVALARGDRQEALAAARRSYDAICESMGADDLAAAMQLVTLARCEAACGLASAEDRFRQACALRMPPRHPRRAQVHEAYAVFLESAGRHAEAEQMRAIAEASKDERR